MEGNTKNPEALHEIAKDKTKIDNPAFVNPGTPASPLVQAADMPSGKVKGAANDVLKNSIIK